MKVLLNGRENLRSAHHTPRPSSPAKQAVAKAAAGARGGAKAAASVSHTAAAVVRSACAGMRSGVRSGRDALAKGIASVSSRHACMHTYASSTSADHNAHMCAEYKY